MILMSLLLVLSLERVVGKSPQWHIEYYAARYREWTISKGWLKNDGPSFTLYLLLIAPALILALIEYYLLGSSLALDFVIRRGLLK